MNETFGQWLTKLRESRHLSQTDLAKLSKVSKATISLIEKDKIEQPRLDGLDNIARSLGISSAEIRMAYAEKSLGVTIDIPSPLTVLDFEDLTEQEAAEVKNYLKFIVLKRNPEFHQQREQVTHEKKKGMFIPDTPGAVESLPGYDSSQDKTKIENEKDARKRASNDS